MRCNNCGYSNPSGSEKCEKCGAMLNSRNSEPFAHSSEFVSKTINGKQASQPAWDASSSQQTKNTCNKCGYPIVGDAQFCPNCGYSSSGKENQATENKDPLPNKSGTIDPWRSRKDGSFTLTPVERDGENSFSPISFNGNKIELNRENLETGNNTITSKVQAIITQDNKGNWVIENQSQKQTTFIRIEGVVELKKGDHILMGNRLFRFDF